jgi:nucleoside-diphosphate-sugar epimerase
MTTDPAPASGRTAFVTGATGFLGLNLVEQLCAAGWRVTALHRKESDVAALSRHAAERVQGDILDLPALTDAVPEGADAVFHLAADTSIWSRHNSRQMRVNVDGTRNLLAAARRKAARKVVVTSSWSAWGYGGQRPPKSGPIDEETPKLGDRSWINYERTKYFAEVMVAGAVHDGVDATVLNPTHIVGRYDRHNWSRLIGLAVRGKLPAIPPGSGTFCHAEAVARAHIAAVDRGRTGANYLLGGPVATYREFVGVVERVSGRKARARPIPRWLFRAVARAKGWWGDRRDREPEVTPEAAALVLANPQVTSDRAARELGYECPDLESMIRDCYEWMKSEGLA